MVPSAEREGRWEQSCLVPLQRFRPFDWVKEWSEIWLWAREGRRSLGHRRILFSCRGEKEEAGSRAIEKVMRRPFSSFLRLSPHTPIGTHFRAFPCRPAWVHTQSFGSCSVDLPASLPRKNSSHVKITCGIPGWGCHRCMLGLVHQAVHKAAETPELTRLKFQDSFTIWERGEQKGLAPAPPGR